MILLGRDRRLVEVKSWQEVTEVGGYVEKVDSKTTEIEDLLGFYTLPEKPSCGLQNCSTPHIKGYIALFKNGEVTNMGNVCGKKHFGVNFDEVKARFTIAYNSADYKDAISSFRNSIDPTLQKIEFLTNGEKQGIWCVNTVKAHAERLYPNKTLEALAIRAKTNKGKLVRTEQLSQKELDDLPKGTPKFREIPIGEIVCISALKDYKTLRKILSVDLGSEMQKFHTIDEHELRYSDLKWWYKWTQRVDKKIREAERIIRDCQRFLVPSNTRLIQDHKNLL